jgi:hypothetical protein
MTTIKLFLGGPQPRIAVRSSGLRVALNPDDLDRKNSEGQQLLRKSNSAGAARV